MQVLIARLSSSPDCGENADNRIRGVVHISRCVDGFVCVRVCVTAIIRKKVEIWERVWI